MGIYDNKKNPPRQSAYGNDDIPQTITARNSSDPSHPDSSDFGAVLPPGHIIPGEPPSSNDPANS